MQGGDLEPRDPLNLILVRLGHLVRHPEGDEGFRREALERLRDVYCDLQDKLVVSKRPEIPVAAGAQGPSGVGTGAGENLVSPEREKASSCKRKSESPGEERSGKRRKRSSAAAEKPKEKKDKKSRRKEKKDSARKEKDRSLPSVTPPVEPRPEGETHKSPGEKKDKEVSKEKLLPAESPGGRGDKDSDRVLEAKKEPAEEEEEEEEEEVEEEEEDPPEQEVRIYPRIPTPSPRRRRSPAGHRDRGTDHVSRRASSSKGTAHRRGDLRSQSPVSRRSSSWRTAEERKSQRRNQGSWREAPDTRRPTQPIGPPPGIFTRPGYRQWGAKPPRNRGVQKRVRSKDIRDHGWSDRRKDARLEQRRK